MGKLLQRLTGHKDENPAPLDPDDPIHIRVRELRKSYGEFEILKGIDLDIYRRQTNMILGPSGSGKTVLMRQLIRLEEPDSGQILVDGVDIAQLQGLEMARVRRKFGMVFQQSALFDSMTVYDNVAFPLREHTKLKPKEVRERVMGRLEDLGVAHAAPKMPSELSGGMQKRVAVARAIVLETDIVIYDEPTTGLDPITSRAVDDLIVETQEKFGVTTLIISHDMASVFRIADYLNFLHFGKIEASGTPKDFMHADSAATKRFLEASGVSSDALQERHEMPRPGS
jgi:phospholipid/cholesterol/gamma-HCH transport system ATP-binding protein